MKVRCHDFMTFLISLIATSIIDLALYLLAVGGANILSALAGKRMLISMRGIILFHAAFFK